jgi:hypothetical protein
VNPSQEPAQPQPPSPPPADPTAEPSLGGGRPAGDPTGPAGLNLPGAAPQFARPEQPDVYETGEAAGGGYGPAHPSGPDPYGLAAGGYVDAAGPAWPVRSRARRPWQRTAMVAVVSAVVILALGGPLGLLWAWLAPSVPVIDTGANGIVVNDPSPEEYIAADGWFTLLGLGFGVLVAVLAWRILRRDRGPFLLLGVILGTLAAGYLVAPRVGEMIGRDAYARWRETAAQGATYLAPPELHAIGPTLVPAFAAAIVLTLLAGWSNDPDLDEPGAKPGYGPNAATQPPAGVPGFDPAVPGFDPAVPGFDPAVPGFDPAGGPVIGGPVPDGPVAPESAARRLTDL